MAHNLPNSIDIIDNIINIIDMQACKTDRTSQDKSQDEKGKEHVKSQAE